MNNLKGKKTKKLIAVALSLSLLMMIVAPHQLFAGQCERALKRCMIDAGIAMIMGAIAGSFSGNFIGSLFGATAAGGSYATMCLAGFDFCNRYLDDYEYDAEK
jgi:hypothetical protein